jgi:hypothetical protein
VAEFRHIPIPELNLKYRLRAKRHLVRSVNIETLDALKQTLKELGYSKKAINEIVKWYK